MVIAVTNAAMEIDTVRHKALRLYLETGKPKGLDGQVAARIRNMVALLARAGDIEELRIPPNFGFHALTGDRARSYATTLTRNWRMTFALSDEGAIVELDLEDYH